MGREAPPGLIKRGHFWHIKKTIGGKRVFRSTGTWEWEVKIPELGNSVFIIPAERVKNREDRLVVLNEVAMSVVDEVRGKHPDNVFTYEGKPVGSMNRKAWRNGRTRAGYLLCASTISSIPSATGCVTLVFLSRTYKAFSGTSPAGSLTCTQDQALADFSPRPTRFATTNGTKMEQLSS